MRNFYQQCSASLDVLWADTKWTVWTEASHDDQRSTDTTLDTVCHNNNLSIDLRRDLWTYNTYTELHYSYTFY